MPVIAGGVEASLRRLAHYDYWSDTVRRSILLDCKADLVVYGMGEQTIVEIAQRLAAGKTVRDLRDLRGVAYALGAKESDELQAASGASAGLRDGRTAPVVTRRSSADKLAFAEATRIIHIEHQPVQRRDAGAVPRPPGRRRRPAGVAAHAKRRWTRSTTCRTRAGRTRRTPSRSPPTR